MGYWCTLHLFDDRKFYNEVVPTLKGERGDLAADYHKYLKNSYRGGIDRLSGEKVDAMILRDVSAIIKLSNQLSADFRAHPDYPVNTNRESDIYNLEGYHEFTRFFEQYVFMTCADFLPHVILGKGGVYRNFEVHHRALASSIISLLDFWNPLFCNDMMGITSWITHEDVELLDLDREKMKVEENYWGEEILKFITIARQNSLGFIKGIDMREHQLARLPNYKLISAERWESMEKQGLRFKL